MEISVVLPISRCPEKIYSNHTSLLCRALRELQWHLANCPITQCLTARMTLSKSLPIIKTSRFVLPKDTQAHPCMCTYPCVCWAPTSAFAVEIQIGLEVKREDTPFIPCAVMNLTQFSFSSSTISPDLGTFVNKEIVAFF